MDNHLVYSFKIFIYSRHIYDVYTCIIRLYSTKYWFGAETNLKHFHIGQEIFHLMT